MSKLLTTKQVAELLSCSQTFVLDRARSGELIGSRLGSHWRFTQSAVDAFLVRCEYVPVESKAKKPLAVIRPNASLPILDRLCAQRKIEY